MDIIHQIRTRRKTLGLQQSDMKLKIGMNQQQYQRIEKGGNPSLKTMELIAEGLDAELLLIPKDKLREVIRVLNSSSDDSVEDIIPDIDQDPWSDLLK